MDSQERAQFGSKVKKMVIGFVATLLGLLDVIFINQSCTRSISTKFNRSGSYNHDGYHENCGIWTVYLSLGQKNQTLS